MQYTTQVEGSPYQIRPGEAFSAYALRMDDATGGSFLADYASTHPDVVDFLGAVESGVLADALRSEVSEPDLERVTDSPDFESMTCAFDGEGEVTDVWVLVAGALDDCMTRADLIGFFETRVPGVLARVAARLRGA